MDFEVPPNTITCTGSPIRNGPSPPAFAEMPRYFFHVHGTRPFHDDGGLDLPGDAAAWEEAKRFVRDIESALEPGETWHLEVPRDGGAIYSLKLCTRAIGRQKR